MFFHHHTLGGRELIAGKLRAQNRFRRVLPLGCVLLLVVGCRLPEYREQSEPNGPNKLAAARFAILHDLGTSDEAVSAFPSPVDSQDPVVSAQEPASPAKPINTSDATNPELQVCSTGTQSLSRPNLFQADNARVRKVRTSAGTDRKAASNDNPVIAGSSVIRAGDAVNLVAAVPVEGEVQPANLETRSGESDDVVRVTADLKSRTVPPAPVPSNTAEDNPIVPVAGDASDVHCCSTLRYGVHSDSCFENCKTGWDTMTPIPWQVFAQGEYIGPPRLAHVPEYRLRVDDVLEFVYRLTGKADPRPYRFNIGDTLKIESLTAKELDRQVLIQPDGTITLRQIGQVPAAGRTVEELRKDLDQRYQKLVREPNMTVTPIELNTTLEELRSTVDRRAGAGGQSRQSKVDPEGTVQLPAIGSVPAHGLTLTELKREIEHRYAALVHGIEVTPILVQRAPRFVYVVGEVRNPGRFTLEGPTTSMQAIAMAGSWNVGAELEEVIVFRRDQNWRLMATKLNLRDAFYREDACPQDEIWLRDSDIVLVPKSTLLETDDFINLFFTRGLYGVVPFNTSVSFFKDLTTIGAIIP